jgi:hypothetical protein
MHRRLWRLDCTERFATLFVVARNPFEQLQDLVPEPRQAFEDIATSILKGVLPSGRRVRVHRGDGGIDLFTGKLGTEGSADVYQVKYFVRPWEDSQKQQIRDAYNTARHSNDYQLNKWTLCVPVRLTKEDLRWFDEWKSKQDRTIELMDGDDLTQHLAHENCAATRGKLCEWGVLGLQAGGPQFRVTAIVRKRERYTTTVILQLRNDGDRSGKNVKATISHSETHCVAQTAHEDWQDCGDGQINPRFLRYRQTLNPGDNCLIMGIPIVEKTPLPLRIDIKLTADDCKPSSVACQIAENDVLEFASVAFWPLQLQSERVSTISETKETRRFSPTSPAAKELLDMILEHPVAEERGVTEVLQSPLAPNEAVYIPNTTARGGAMSVKKSVLRAAIEELVHLGWLSQPEGDAKTRIYELIRQDG